MNKANLWALAKEQLAMDLGCGPEIMAAPGNQVLEWNDSEGRRTYQDDLPFLEVLIIDGRLIAASAPPLLPWCRSYFPTQCAEWLFQPARLREIDAALAPLGYEIGDAHHYYLPDPALPPVSPTGPVAWYERDALEQFRGDSRWDGTLAFHHRYPDMLAVAALDAQGAPIAMAGASRDGARMWQIGINVLPPYRGRGLAVNLTALLKDELLRRDIVPFYGTSESHIVSQNVAIRSGFRSAFGYLYAQRAAPAAPQPPTSPTKGTDHYG